MDSHRIWLHQQQLWWDLHVFAWRMTLFIDFHMCSVLWGFVGLCFHSACIDVVLSIWLAAQRELQSIDTIGTTHPDSADDHNTEMWKHRGETPKPPTLVSLCSRCVFRLFLASPSFSLFWHTPKHGYETQEVRVTVVCSLLTRCLEVKFLLILTLVSLLREMSKTTRCKSGNKQTTEKREHKNTPKKIFLFC